MLSLNSKICIKQAVLAGALLFAIPVFAVDVDSVVSIGYDDGGDELINLRFNDGKTQSIRANQGVVVALGAIFYNTSDLTWQTQATIGAKYKPINATNGDATWRAVPIEIIEFFNTNLIRFGIGLSYQVAPSLKTSGVISEYRVDMNDALGYVAQIGFRPKKRGGISVDVRYTYIEYSGDIIAYGVRQPIRDVSGDSAGVYLNVLF